MDTRRRPGTEDDNLAAVPSGPNSVPNQNGLTS
jgi:hypothetical protein